MIHSLSSNPYQSKCACSSSRNSAKALSLIQGNLVLQLIDTYGKFAYSDTGNHESVEHPGKLRHKMSTLDGTDTKAPDPVFSHHCFSRPKQLMLPGRAKIQKNASFVCKIECLILSADDNRTIWSIGRKVSRNFCSSIFNFTGDLFLNHTRMLRFPIPEAPRSPVHFLSSHVPIFHVI